MKVCSKCGQAKSADCFGLRKGAPDGRRGVCKQCLGPQRLAYGRKYAALNADKKKESFKRWYARNREAMQERSRRYYADNSDALRANARMRYWSDPDKHRQSQRDYARKHPEKVKARRTEWGKQNPEVIAEYRHRGYWRNPDRARERRRNNHAKARERLTDGYVRTRLCFKTPLRHRDVPQSLVDAKRVHLQIKRLLKEKTA